MKTSTSSSTVFLLQLISLSIRWETFVVLMIMNKEAETHLPYTALSRSDHDQVLFP